MKKLIIFSIILCTVFPGRSKSQSLTWQRLYNGQSDHSDNGRGVCESKNGDLYVTGYVSPYVASVLKLKPNGDTIWSKTFGGLRGDFILGTNDGGCIITGESISSVYTLRLDSNGNILWLKTYAGSDQIITTGMINTDDNGYFICGYQTGNKLIPGYTIKIDSSGNIQWHKFFFSGNVKVFYSVAQKLNHNFIISGYKYECKFCNGYPLLLEINSSGDSLWEKTYNLLADFKKIFAYKNGYLIGGTIRDSPFVYVNSFIMRTDLDGNIFFRKNIIYDNREDFKDMSVINNNRYVIACDTDTMKRRSAGVYIVDSSCNVLYRNVFYVTDYSLFFSIQPLRNGDIAFSGTVDTHLTQSRDIYVVRSDSMLFAKPVGVKELNNFVSTEFILFQNYPNPFNPDTKIKYDLVNMSKEKYQIKMHDILGKEIAIYSLKESFGEISFTGKSLTSGIYFYSLWKNDVLLQTKQMLLIK